MATLAEIWRYPVKSMAGQMLVETELGPAGVPGDRQFALAHGAGDFDPAAPAWRPKGNFVNLVRTEAMAGLSVAFDPDAALLTITRGGSTVAEASVRDPYGAAGLALALSGLLGEAARGQVRLAHADGVVFSDAPTPLVSVINLASVRDLAERSGLAIDPRRFRGNLVIDGLRPWGEVDWSGRRAQVGEAVIRVVEPIVRCAATHVDPDTARRNLDVVGALERTCGHVEMGVYAEVVIPGGIAAGDEVVLL
jgi:uncharacterized protein YcbX